MTKAMKLADKLTEWAGGCEGGDEPVDLFVASAELRRSEAEVSRLKAALEKRGRYLATARICSNCGGPCDMGRALNLMQSDALYCGRACATRTGEPCSCSVSLGSPLPHASFCPQRPNGGARTECKCDIDDTSMMPRHHDAACPQRPAGGTNG